MTIDPRFFNSYAKNPIPRRTGKKRETPEADLQKAVVVQLRKTFRDWYIHGSLMGVNLGPRKGAEAKAMGCMAGYPDITLISPSGVVSFLELKSPEKNVTNSSLKPEQIIFRDRCASEWGLNYKVVNSVEQAIEIVRGWL